MRAMTDIEKGYCAGLLDGEGCIWFRRKWGQVIISNNDLACLEYIKNISGIGDVYCYKRNRRGDYKRYNKKECRFIISNTIDIINFLTILSPLLIIKKKEAYKMLKHLANVKSYILHLKRFKN